MLRFVIEEQQNRFNTMKEKKHNIKYFLFFEPLIIITFWVLLLSSPILLGSSEEGIVWQQIFKIWISFLPYLILFFIVHFILLPFLFFRNKRWLFSLSAIALIGLMAIGVSFQFNDTRPPMHGDRELSDQQFSRGLPPAHPGPNGGVFPNKPAPPKQLPPHLIFIIISLLIVGFDTGLKLSVKWVQSEQKRINAEKENVESQLAFLRNQISPHFFMNTLNNIHSLIDFDTEQAKDSIIQLSKLMRHLLYDSESDKIALQKEISFIKNYVDLMKLRFSDKVIINLEIPEQLPNKSIPPLLFTSYVENAFKHGVSYKKASFINISFSFSEDELTFNIINSKADNVQVEEPSGIGIANSQKRLNLIYGRNYTLEIADGKTEYSVHLNLPI